MEFHKKNLFLVKNHINLYSSYKRYNITFSIILSFFNFFFFHNKKLLFHIKLHYNIGSCYVIYFIYEYHMHNYTFYTEVYLITRK